MTTHDTWILVADSYKARLFSAKKIEHDWILLEEFEHPESRERDVDLVSDRYGNFRTSYEAAGGSSYAEQTDPKETVIDNFARTLAKKLNLGRSQSAFERLIIVSPSRFHGKLVKHCDTHTQRMIYKHLEKDYTNLREQELVPMVISRMF